MSDTSWTESSAPETSVRDYFALLKPRVMSLVILTAAVAMLVAPGGSHPLIAAASLLCIAVGAGASGALNMWWDSDIDAQMKRTAGRPIPAGRMPRDSAFAFGIILSVLSVTLLAVFGNPLSAALLAFTIFFYAVIYSMWLKRATPQNIVIGGAAGAIPPVIGWAAVTGNVTIEPLLMFALIFLWTPPHFWALALFTNEDYTRVGVPMLPVVKGERTTRLQTLLYTIILAPAALALAFTEVGGPIYLIVAVFFNARFLWGSWVLWQRDEATATADKYTAEKRVFLQSIGYLFAHFLALAADGLCRMAGWSFDAWPIWF